MGIMKISIERGTLLKALAQAQSVVERRNTIPILANVLIEAEGAQVSFRANAKRAAHCASTHPTNVATPQTISGSNMPRAWHAHRQARPVQSAGADQASQSIGNTGWDSSQRA